jgi:hypothetical protein
LYTEFEATEIYGGIMLKGWKKILSSIVFQLTVHEVIETWNIYEKNNKKYCNDDETGNLM